ncbi:MAG TPA: hypothetical protein VK666_00975 [Chryseolinea sp.]|nr:hypothetical protein [Chryseolinea sp.]
MKKIIYMLLIAMATAMTVTACTDEEVKPATTMNGGGAGLPEPK